MKKVFGNTYIAVREKRDFSAKKLNTQILLKLLRYKNFSMKYLLKNV